jgi:hypothetical protein
VVKTLTDFFYSLVSPFNQPQPNKTLDLVSNVLIVVGWFGWTGAHAVFAETSLSRAAWVVLMLAVPLTLYWIIRRVSLPSPGPIANWYQVSFDTAGIQITLAPPAKPMTRTILWHEITSAKFVARDLFASDEVWLYSAARRSPFIKIPTEAAGGSELVGELAARDLIALESMSAKG